MSRKRGYSAASFNEIARGAPDKLKDQLQEHHGPDAALECSRHNIRNRTMLLPALHARACACSPRYMGVELHDGTFDRDAELWKNTKVVFEWILRCNSAVKRLRTSAVCRSVKDRAAPPAPKIFGKLFSMVQLKKAGQRAVTKLRESVAEADGRGWALDCVYRPQGVVRSVH